MPSTLKIGEVARRAGVAVDTVRFYERRGVLPVTARRPSGYREFPKATVDRIRFARELQQLGFTLTEVVELLGAIDGGTATCQSERVRFESVLQRIDEKLASLRAVRDRLAETIRSCRDGSCTLLEQAASAHAGAVRRR